MPVVFPKLLMLELAHVYREVQEKLATEFMVQ
jgi:hypothetical protein